MTKTIVEMAEYVASQLLAAGFIIQRYDSMSSQSIYLKLDYGVCNSIRISDHKGLSQYRYRYNLQSNRTGFRKHSNSGVDRLYYGFDAVETMLQDIREDKAEKVLSYGLENYSHFMEVNERVNSGKKGFWSSSHEVAVGSYER